MESPRERLSRAGRAGLPISNCSVIYWWARWKLSRSF